jgi:hypothetical protein
LTSDHKTIESVAQMILNDKRNITELTISSDGNFEIPSDSSSIINISGNDGEKAKFVVDSNSSSNINKEITVNYSDNKVVFPAGTKITGPDGWTGEMSLPRIKTSPTIIPPVSGRVDVLQTITIGDKGDFTFDKPVHLIFNGQAGKRVGFIKGDPLTFTEIEACDGTNNIPEGRQDCKYDLGLNLIVLTKHFTEFVVFTATPISSGGGGGSIYTFSNVRADVQSNQVLDLI